MAQRISRKSLKHDEFVETAFDAGEWVEEHWKQVAAVAGAIVAVILLGAVWMTWSAHRADAAVATFGEAFDAYRPPEGSDPRWDEALGGFEKAEKQAGGALADVAAFYRGVTLFRSGDAAAAVPVLQRVAEGASSAALTGTARATLAEALAQTGDVEGAIALWRGLVEAEDGLYPPEHALLNLGRLQRAEGRTGEARDTFQEIQDAYPVSAAAREAGALLEQM